MGKSRNRPQSRGTTLQELYALRDNLEKLGKAPQGDEFYDYAVKVLKIVSCFQDENHISGFRMLGVGSPLRRSFTKIKQNFVSNLSKLGRKTRINHTTWRDPITLRLVYFTYHAKGAKIQNTAYGWKNSKDPNKERYTEKFRADFQHKIDELKKSIEEFIKIAE